MGSGLQAKVWRIRMFVLEFFNGTHHDSVRSRNGMCKDLQDMPDRISSFPDRISLNRDVSDTYPWEMNHPKSCLSGKTNSEPMNMMHNGWSDVEGATDRLSSGHVWWHRSTGFANFSTGLSSDDDGKLVGAWI